MVQKRTTKKRPKRTSKSLSQLAMEDDEKKRHKKERIAPRDAAVAANEYYTRLTGYEGDASIEEIELTENGKRWRVTLGLRVMPVVTFGPKMYKLFEVDAYTGEVLSMKIREL